MTAICLLAINAEPPLNVPRHACSIAYAGTLERCPPPCHRCEEQATGQRLSEQENSATCAGGDSSQKGSAAIPGRDVQLPFTQLERCSTQGFAATALLCHPHASVSMLAKASGHETGDLCQGGGKGHWQHVDFKPVPGPGFLTRLTRHVRCSQAFPCIHTLPPAISMLRRTTLHER